MFARKKKNHDEGYFVPDMKSRVFLFIFCRADQKSQEAKRDGCGISSNITHLCGNKKEKSRSG